MTLHTKSFNVDLTMSDVSAQSQSGARSHTQTTQCVDRCTLCETKVHKRVSEFTLVTLYILYSNSSFSPH